MSCVTDKPPCHEELMFSVNLLSCSGLKPAHFKGELLFILICDGMQSMLFVQSLICALQSEEQHICDSLQNKPISMFLPFMGSNLGMSSLCLSILCYNNIEIVAGMATQDDDLFQLIEVRLWTWLSV